MTLFVPQANKVWGHLGSTNNKAYVFLKYNSMFSCFLLTVLSYLHSGIVFKELFSKELFSKATNGQFH